MIYFIIENQTYYDQIGEQTGCQICVEIAEMKKAGEYPADGRVNQYQCGGDHITHMPFYSVPVVDSERIKCYQQ